MAEARAVKFCTKGYYIKSCQKDDKLPLKEHGFAHVTHFFMHNCGVRKNYPRHSVSCEPAINNVIDDRLLLIAPTVLEATLRFRTKFHRFNLSLYLLQSWLYNI